MARGPPFGVDDQEIVMADPRCVLGDVLPHDDVLVEVEFERTAAFAWAELRVLVGGDSGPFTEEKPKRFPVGALRGDDSAPLRLFSNPDRGVPKLVCA